MLVSALTRMEKQWSSVDKKQEKLQNYYQKKFQSVEVSWKRVLEVTDYDVIFLFSFFEK